MNLLKEERPGSAALWDVQFTARGFEMASQAKICASLLLHSYFLQTSRAETVLKGLDGLGLRALESVRAGTGGHSWEVLALLSL